MTLKRLPLRQLAQGTATDGQTPVWNDTTKVWEPKTPATGGALPAGGTTGQVLTKLSSTAGDAGWSTPAGGGGGTGGRVLLRETTLATAAASVTFTSSDIPTSGYRNLRLEALTRSDQAAASSTVYLSINGDTTDANYRRSLEFKNEGGSGQAGNTVDRLIAQVEGTTSLMGATVPVFLDILVPDFLGTTWHKGVTCRQTNFGRGQSSYTVARLNAAAVTSLALTMTGGNFKAGSVFRLYGEPV